MRLLKVGEKIIEGLSKKNIKMAEVYGIDCNSTVIEVKNQEVDTFKVANDCGVGVRIFDNGRLGFSYSSDLNKKGIENLIANCLSTVSNTERDLNNKFTSFETDYPKVKIYDAMLKKISSAEKIEALKKVEKTAFNYDKRIKKVRHIAYKDSIYKVSILNSNGVNVSYQGTYSTLSSVVIAEDGSESQAGWDMDFSRKYKKLKFEEVGVNSAKKAVSLLGARTIKTMKGIAVLDPYVAAEFVGILGSMLSAEAVQKGKSIFRGRLGQKVASSSVTVLDDGLLAGGIASAPCDDEGTPMQKTFLIREGELETFLHNTYTANKEGVKPTGNGIRDSYYNLPNVGKTNLFVEKGTIKEKSLLNSVKKGLYISEVMGVHTANLISGDFSFGASGYWIEGGELVFPVRGITISGNIFDLLKNIDMVADDLRFLGNIGSPTLRIVEISIGGK